MLGDIDIEEFRKLWNAMIREYEIEDNRWVLEMYRKREMWSSAYLQGQFFAGYRTTGKFVHSKYNLNAFMHHLHRCVSYIRFTELKDILSLAL
jgi:hypothetical protein